MDVQTQSQPSRLTGFPREYVARFPRMVILAWELASTALTTREVVGISLKGRSGGFVQISVSIKALS